MHKLYTILLRQLKPKQLAQKCIFVSFIKLYFDISVPNQHQDHEIKGGTIRYSYCPPFPVHLMSTTSSTPLKIHLFLTPKLPQLLLLDADGAALRSVQKTAYPVTTKKLVNP